MADVSDDGGSVANQIDHSEETSPEDLNAVTRENALRVERNCRRAERRADAVDLAAVSDDEPLIEVPSRTTSPAPSPQETPSSVGSSPSLAMHSALQNFDIICTICSYVHRGSLPALASTCRVFERPALDVLWRNLRSVEPLVKCLPSDLFGIEKGHMALLKPLDAKTWNILCKYTSRVRSITQLDRLAVIKPLASLILSCPLTPASMFPNLRELKWHADETHCAAEFLRMAFVPTLLSLDVVIYSASSIFLSVLSSLGTLCPQLQRMSVESRSPTNDSDMVLKASPFIAQSISQLHHLRELFVWDLGNQGNEHLAQLRALRKLWLDLETSSVWERRLRLRFPGFRDLDFLMFFITNLEHALEFLNSLQVIGSKSVQISFIPTLPFTSPSTTLYQFFATLGEICDHDNLVSFSLDQCSVKVNAKLDVFTPLYPCRNLTRLLIENGCDISMTDKELLQLMRAWPKLEVLAISRFVSIKGTTIPTFRGLISFPRLCPALTSLTLVIDTTLWHGIDLKSPGGGIRNQNLKNLVLGNSPVGSPAQVALILNGLFPNLKKINLNCWYSAPKKFLSQQQAAMPQWEAVNFSLLSFSIVKERCAET
ncbi:uncharacterized protein BJ212DRAFT_1480683 [Suillus subaureus]|uniref:F-box domain-containing protein n=1 Tax=Suillus subaureus TaxID=48587 RepID=A0A9P7JDU1_9AGAM|nr:uncharacterized protein BJ212DRAFT_1480683 [Suillus subaureus]KAG1816828.1 hypothetical protein BJ212DRAFT_1480683 [Suillus subaureus]